MNETSEQARATLDIANSLIDLFFSADIIPVLRPDGEVGWMPRPAHIDCPLCGGEGMSLVNGQIMICPYCHGTGAEDTDVQ